LENKLTKVSNANDSELQQQLKQSGHIPTHIAVIMDGNGRWAKAKGYPRLQGHREGIESVRDIVEASAQLGVKHLTLYTFSKENWKRPVEEVTTLMRLLVRSLRKELNVLHSNNIRLTMIGDMESLPEIVQKELLDAKSKTDKNTGLNLILALSYSGRWEIIEAVKKIAQQVKSGEIQPESITPELFEMNLATAGIPDPDLLIRTSGELRISNYLLWQIAYSEIYVTDVFWPEFRRDYLYEAIKAFQKRERRFGKVSEQLHKNNKGQQNVEQLSK